VALSGLFELASRTSAFGDKADILNPLTNVR